MRKHTDHLPAAVPTPRDSSGWPSASLRQLTAWRKLSTKKGRAASGEIIVEGVRLVREALRGGCELIACLVCDDAQGMKAAYQLVATLPRGAVPVTVRPRDFAKLTDTVHAAGIAAVVAWKPEAFDAAEKPEKPVSRVLICDRISDPGNLGTLIRTAAGLGIERIFTHPDAVELTNPKVVRATAGTLFRVPVHGHVPAADIAAWCRRRRLTVLVADAHHGRPLAAAPRFKHWAVVVGGETLPLDPIWDAAAMRRVRLPLAHGVESLNAAVAGAIIMDRLCRE